MMMEFAYALSAGILGCFFGAQLCEAVLFVPYWKSMDPLEFHKFYKRYGGMIHRFFSPLTILAFLIPSITVFVGLISGQGRAFLHLALGLSCLMFFSTYFLFFKKANRTFNTVLMDEVLKAKSLNEWAKWHWTRVIIECVAFSLALYLLY